MAEIGMVRALKVGGGTRMHNYVLLCPFAIARTTVPQYTDTVRCVPVRLAQKKGFIVFELTSVITKVL